MIRHAVVVESSLAPAVARSNFLAWIQAVGYRPTTPAFLSSIEFERGSIGHNAVTVNPQRWRVTVAANFEAGEGEGSRVQLEWKIVTAGQVVTRDDIAYWRHEVAEGTAAVKGDALNPAETEKRRLKAMSGNVWRAILLTVATLTPIVASVFLFELRVPLYLLSGVLGAIVYFSVRSPRRL